LEVFVPQAVEVVVEVGELIGQDITVWDNIEILFSILFLHFNDVCDKSVLSGKLV
jgi:hypothetical protein